MYEYRATIKNVVDLDTFDMLLDLGFDISILHRVRLLGIDGFESKLIRGNTREQVEKGLEGKKKLREWLTGKETIIRTHKDDSDKYGRYLGVIIINENNKEVIINQWILDNGYGKKYDV